MKMLIGVSAPHNKLSLSVIEILSGALNLEHINMRQPVVSMLAALMKMDPAHLHYDTPFTTAVPGLNTNVADLETSIAFQLRTLNPRYFIEQAGAAMATSKNSVKNALFDGYIVAGINTELEAQWVRDSGGLMIHIHDYTPQNIVNFHALHELDGDIAIPTATTIASAENVVYATAENIRSLYAARIREAA